VASLYQDAALFVVGYGLLRQTEDGRWWSSVAVLPSYTGRGYGGAITALTTRTKATTARATRRRRRWPPQHDLIARTGST
jgi:hypothetical protein